MLHWPGTLLALFVTFASACTSFSGTGVDGGTDAGTDAVVPDMASTQDSGMVNNVAVRRRVYPPPNGTVDDVGYSYILSDGTLAADTQNRAPTEPYCLLRKPSGARGANRWLSCGAGESYSACIARPSSACAEYPSTTIGPRAMACDFETIAANRPTCSPMQYPRSLCADCGAAVCKVYADGSHECLDVGAGDEPSRRSVGVCTHSPGGQMFFVGVTPAMGVESPTATGCVGGTDCYFTARGEAKCVEKAPVLARYPLRGCDDEALATATQCHVSANELTNAPQYSSASPSSGPYCTAVRGTSDEPWSTIWSDLDAELSCTLHQLCDLQDGEFGCVEPRWSLNENAGELRYVCGECLGVPCFVYEDGSDECTHTPTRGAEDAGVPCCQKLAQNIGFQAGKSVKRGIVNEFIATDGTGGASSCSFLPDGTAVPSP